jgi:hypothetical protein
LNRHDASGQADRELAIALRDPSMPRHRGSGWIEQVRALPHRNGEPLALIEV